MAREYDDIRQAAFNITAAFEGSGYDSYQNYDGGIVSYGRFQFTLASGNLAVVLERYLTAAAGPIADALRLYLPRARDRDPALRQDDAFKSLLLQAAGEPAMQAAQDSVTADKFWTLVLDLSIRPRNIQTPLGIALIFDMAINHGPRHDMIGLAEQALGVPPKSRMPDNGADERDLLRALARIRAERLNRLADKYGWEGLRGRGQFWLDLIYKGDWDLLGDARGQVEIRPGCQARVRAVD